LFENARRSGQGPSFAQATAYGSEVYFPLRLPNLICDLLQPALTVIEQGGMSYWRARASRLLGWAIARQGNPDQGIAMIRSAQADMRATGASSSPGGATLPDALLNTGRYDEAIEAADDTISDLVPYHFWLAELYRLKGDAILGRDPLATSEAEQYFRKAIEVARGKSAKWWELRATTSLARLLAKQGHRDEARSMLAEIYNWFTEGFDTADLKDAKALLDEMHE
jgi:predicted ATPase